MTSRARLPMLSLLFLSLIAGCGDSTPDQAPAPTDESSLEATPPAEAPPTAAPAAQPSAKTSAPVLEVGSAAPDFELPVMGGGTVKLPDAAGSKVVVIAVWAAYNDYCADQLRAVQHSAAEYDAANVQVIAVNDRDTATIARQFLDKHQLDVPVALDINGEIAAAYGIAELPYTVVVDQQGVIQKIQKGYIPSMQSDIRGKLTSLLESQGATAAEEPGETADAPE